MNSPVLFQSLTRFRLFFFVLFHNFISFTCIRSKFFVLFSSVVLALQSIIIMEYLRLITSYSDKVKKYKQQQQQISQVNKKRAQCEKNSLIPSKICCSSYTGYSRSYTLWTEEKKNNNNRSRRRRRNLWYCCCFFIEINYSNFFFY